MIYNLAAIKHEIDEIPEKMVRLDPPTNDEEVLILQGQIAEARGHFQNLDHRLAWLQVLIGRMYIAAQPPSSIPRAKPLTLDDLASL